MAKTKKEKKEIVETYVGKLNNSKAFYVITPTEITPNEAIALRKKLHESNSSFNLVKNSLFKLALESAKKELKSTAFDGENAIVFVEGEPTEGAKAIYEFIKDIKKGAIKGGMLDGQELIKTDIEELAKLPSKDVLIGQVVGTIAAPLSGFVNVLNANITGFVNVLKNISEKE